MLLKVHWVLSVKLLFHYIKYLNYECSDGNGISDDEIPKYHGPYNRRRKSQKMPSTQSRHATRSMSQGSRIAESVGDTGMAHKSNKSVNLYLHHKFTC